MVCRRWSRKVHVLVYGSMHDACAARTSPRMPETWFSVFLKCRPEWQFLIDVIPTQLAAERLAHLSGVDCDSFRLCSYIVENEWGLLHENVGAAMKDNDIGFSKEVAIKKLKK
jgi:hypothetical protein